MAAIRSLRDASATGGRAAIAAMKAVARTLAGTTTILRRWYKRRVDWLKPRVDKAADEFANSFGKTAGRLAAAAIIGHVTGADKQLTTLIKMIWQWVGPN